MEYRPRMTAGTAFFSAVIVAILGFYGAWQRQWMSDDGLIVLRTVRNLLAGNGPVFNAGERVEANTSTLWQYLIYVVALFSDAKLEYIAFWLAIIFSTAALFIAAWATALLYREKTVFLVPLGGLVYIALPPARDFMTSGLEWGLAMLWIAIQWLLLIRWAYGKPQANRRHRQLPIDWPLYLLAFWSGLSWLVRPELALYGGLVGIILLLTAVSWRAMITVLIVALPLPLGYEIFRMGYYGLLVPHTAVAKTAAGSQWSSGWKYVEDFTSPYSLYWALALTLIVGALMLCTVTNKRGAIKNRCALRRPSIAIIFMVLCAILHLLYVIRVGGDFMHGRMLLLPLFTLLLPVSVVGIVSGDQEGFKWPFWGASVVFVGTVWWSVTTVLGGHPYHLPQDLSADELNIVDEREFWTQLSKRDTPPMTAEDFLTAPTMGDWQEVMEESLGQNAGEMLNILVGIDPLKYSWEPAQRTPEATDLAIMPMTVTMLNLGMTSMNAPLDVRVVDSVGLANPLAARQPRIEDGRIGHDKLLPMEWQVADSAVDLNTIPIWIDRRDAQVARWVLYTDEFRSLFEVYRSPMLPGRFWNNMKYALGDGRTLEFSDDPWDYYDLLPVDPVKPIYWRPDIQTDLPR
ncbi:flagellar motor control protein ZomB [Corynebacterium kutscheri]|nr:flagellar motor control protein ZomB [Corynebacterium kutscheri]